jgi:hypothetical protein
MTVHGGGARCPITRAAEDALNVAQRRGLKDPGPVLHFIADELEGRACAESNCNHSGLAGHFRDAASLVRRLALLFYGPVRRHACGSLDPNHRCCGYEPQGCCGS